MRSTILKSAVVLVAAGLTTSALGQQADRQETDREQIPARVIVKPQGDEVGDGNATAADDRDLPQRPGRVIVKSQGDEVGDGDAVVGQTDRQTEIRRTQTERQTGMTDQRRQGQATLQGSDMNQRQAPEGYVLVQEQIIYVLAQQPQEHFVRAMQFIATQDQQAAAQEISLASDFISLQASRADGQVKQELQEIQGDLKDVSQKLSKGNFSQPEQLSTHFAKANLALAEHFHNEAEQALKNDRKIVAGHDLEAAAVSLQQAEAWGEQQPTQEMLTTITNAKAAAVLLLTPDLKASDLQGQDVPQPQAALASLETQINRLDGQLGTAEAQPAGARQGGDMNQTQPKTMTGQKIGDKPKADMDKQGDMKTTPRKTSPDAEVEVEVEPEPEPRTRLQADSPADKDIAPEVGPADANPRN